MRLLVCYPSVNMNSGNMRIRRDSNQLSDSFSSNKGKCAFQVLEREKEIMQVK